jgi:hypothetical protein
MGAGDWIMATSQVKTLYARTGMPVVVVGRDGRPQWSEVFENNPKIARRPSPASVTRLVNAPGVRPYIASKTPERWTWKKWAISPGEIFLTEAEKRFAEHYRGAVLIEPNTKGTNEGNTAWITERWWQLGATRGDFIQVGPVGVDRIPGVPHVVTPSFRLACAVLAVCKGFVGTEGGLHHAAAALGVPAVVLFSEFISPDITGYPMHRNLRHAGPACGSRLRCEGCRRSMLALTVNEVSRNLEEILK